ncbi:MAG: hypothetical protein GC137_00265 [Alphaproteobacteria bacterium]|nr:hypothetical protein [Alphaproteobacteria bacterium]
MTPREREEKNIDHDFQSIESRLDRLETMIYQHKTIDEHELEIIRTLREKIANQVFGDSLFQKVS